MNKKRLIFIGLFLLAAIALVTLTKTEENTLRCKSVIVKIINAPKWPIFKEASIVNLATNYGKEPLEGKYIKDVNLSSIENKIAKSKNIKSCEAYLDQKGNLTLKVSPYVPIARIAESRGAKDRYIDTDGHLFTLEAGFSPRVMLVNGNYFKKTDTLASPVLDFLNYVNKSGFWSSEISQIEINSKGQITLYPMFGNHEIEFGEAVNTEKKLKKLKIFYDKVYSDPKYNHFKQVSVKYANQIVCK